MFSEGVERDRRYDVGKWCWNDVRILLRTLVKMLDSAVSYKPKNPPDGIVWRCIIE